jgi:L-rhamnose-H+ transport protein
MAPLVGIFLHAIGGLAAGSFYTPFRKTHGWSWETCWLVMNVVAYAVMPCAAAWIVAPQFAAALWKSPPGTLALVFFFGVLWGVGGLTFGLSIRYLGMSLGFAMALGLCAACGTLMPPLVHGTFGPFAATLAGQTVLTGIALCLAGISLCGYAGVRKEREMSVEESRDAIKEFSLGKGFLVAAIAGLMSSFMAFGIDAGKTIGQTAVACGISEVYQNVPVLVLVMAGNVVANVIWCLLLGAKASTLGDYAARPARQLLGNYFFAGLAGVIAYNEFFWYGMGTTKMGRYDFSSWSIHLAFVIVFSTLWGLYFREWKGIGPVTRRLLWGGLATLLLSTVVIGAGNCFSSSSEPLNLQNDQPSALSPLPRGIDS